mgnify:CR=1 FL=1
MVRECVNQRSQEGYVIDPVESLHLLSGFIKHFSRSLSHAYAVELIIIVWMVFSVGYTASLLVCEAIMGS